MSLQRPTVLFLLFAIGFSQFLKKQPEELLKEIEEECSQGIDSCLQSGEKLAMYVNGLQQLVAMYTKDTEQLNTLQFNGDRLINPLLNLKDSEDADVFRKDHMNLLVEIQQQAEELMKMLPEEERRQWMELMEKHRAWQQAEEEEL